MKKLLKITNNVHWIDHHISAIRKYDGTGLDTTVKGIRYNGVAGCLLTWAYLFYLKKGELKFEDNLDCLCLAPSFVKYISDHDIWEFNYGLNTKYFQLALRSVENEPIKQIWDDVYYDTFGSYLTHMLNKGKILYDYKRTDDKMYLKRMKFDTYFDGYKTCAVNKALCNSDIFDTLENDDEYDLFMVFSFDGSIYRYTIYPNNKEIDVSVIATKYGGGGHKGAAGFTSKKLLVKKESK
jgi:oligoribonuclease NrnB/cAMP/cGMP phosphodiesterase (DHH superfamily)